MNWISPSLDKLSLKPNAYRVLSCLLQLLCWKPSRKRPVHSWLVFIWSAGSGLPCSGNTWQILDKSIFQPTAETKHIKPTWGRLKLKHAWWEIWKGPSGNSIKEQSNSLGRCHRRTGGPANKVLMMMQSCSSFEKTTKQFCLKHHCRIEPKKFVRRQKRKQIIYAAETTIVNIPKEQRQIGVHTRTCSHTI